jgi:hypothetical protein
MTKTVQRKALKHYDKMITWVKTQESNEPADIFKMMQSIGTIWGSDDCAYCNYIISKGLKCDNCKLANCCDTFYKKMNESEKWKNWLKYAKRIRKFIEEKGI